MVVLLLFQIFILRVKLFQIITQSSIPDFCTDEVLHSMDCQTGAGDDSRSSYPASSSSCFWIISQHCCQLIPEIVRKIFKNYLHDNVSVRERTEKSAMHWVQFYQDWSECGVLWPGIDIVCIYHIPTIDQQLSGRTQWYLHIFRLQATDETDKNPDHLNRSGHLSNSARGWTTVM